MDNNLKEDSNRSIKKLGLKRFNNGIEAQKELMRFTRIIQDQLLLGLPSNYSKDKNTNLSEFFYIIAKEFARLRISLSDINEDKYHDSTRTEYLFQVLGDALFLGDRVINENLDDVSYRNFLIKVRNAYFKGSRKDNIESSVSDILGLPVKLKESYLEVRKGNKSFSKKDMHEMFFDIYVNDVDKKNKLGVLIEDIRFFIDLIKPSHVKYNTRLIWKDELRRAGKETKPSYITKTIDYKAYSIEKAYLLTNRVITLYVSGKPAEYDYLKEGSADIIQENTIISGNDILVVNNDSKLYKYEELNGEYNLIEISINDLSIGDTIYYNSEIDSTGNSSVIDDDWGFTFDVTDVSLENEVIYLEEDKIGVYNKDTLFYTRDSEGEYRFYINEKNLVGFRVALCAEEHTRGFQFYERNGSVTLPEEVINNPYKQFDSNVINKPRFQDYVKKEREHEEEYENVVQDSVSSIRHNTSKFFKLEDTRNYKEVIINKYKLYINGDFKAEYKPTDSKDFDKILTNNEVIELLGYREEVDKAESYKIDRSKTGFLIESNENATVRTVGDDTRPHSQHISNSLITKYEDNRIFHTWPDPVLVSHSIEFVEEKEGLFVYKVINSKDLPMLNKSGDIAGIDDIKVSYNNADAGEFVIGVDSWGGFIILNEKIPEEYAAYVSYWYANRYPDKVSHVKRVGKNISTIENEEGEYNLSAYLKVLSNEDVIKRLNWPFKVSKEMYGDILDYQVNKYPILNREGNLASKEDIVLYLGSRVSSGRLVVNRVSDEEVELECTSGSFSGSDIGDSIVLLDCPEYKKELIIESISIEDNIVTVLDTALESGGSFKFYTVRYTEILDSIVNLRPLLGHIRINFIPPADSFLKFDYYFTEYEREYLMIPDITEDDYYSDIQYTPDTVRGPRSNYTISVDRGPCKEGSPFTDFGDLLKIGYRYRAIDLSNSSVLNSRTFQTGHDPLNKSLTGNYSISFSPEYLEDSSTSIVLNDNYLHKKLDPTTKLNPGIPIFQKTFNDSGRFRGVMVPEGEDTYSEPTDNSIDLKASFNIVQKRESGLSTYRGIKETSTAPYYNLYTDLKVVEHFNNGYDAYLSSLHDNDVSFPMGISFREEYYPNRELRTNDYLDYINQIPEDYKTGNVKFLKGSNIIKSSDTNFIFLNRGDEFYIEDLKQTYTLIEIIDRETAKVHKKFNKNSGTYNYILVRSGVKAVDVLLNELYRKLSIKGPSGFDYGIREEIYDSLPDNFSVDFPDPSTGPYPEGPRDFYEEDDDISGLETVKKTIDGKDVIFNRIRVDEGYTGFEGERDVYIYPNPEGYPEISYKEPEYRVRWRNWDQDFMLITDYEVYYWDFHSQEIGTMSFLGESIVLNPGEIKPEEVDPDDFPEGLILLSLAQKEAIEASSDPIVDFPYLNKDQYRYRSYSIKKVNTNEVVKIDQFIP